MPNYETQIVSAELQQINQLLGGVIETGLDGGDSFGFRVRTPTGRRINVWVDCDPEGNGPGHLNLEPTDARP